MTDEENQGTSAVLEADSQPTKQEGDPAENINLRTEAFLNPFAGDPQSKEPDQGTEDTPTATHNQENETSQDEEKIVFESVKVDGKLTDLAFTKDELKEFAIQKGTFDRRMSEVAREREALNAERNQPLSEDEQELRFKVKALEQLKTDSPEAYAEIINRVNSIQVDKSKPQASVLDKKIEKLEAFAAQNKDVAVLSEFVDLFKTMKEEIDTRDKALLNNFSEVKQSTEKVSKAHEQQQASAQQERLNQEIAETRQFLLDHGLTNEAIASKAGLVEQFHKPGMAVLDVAKMVYAVEIANGNPPSETDKPPSEPSQPSKKTNPKFLNGKSNGIATTDTDTSMSPAEVKRQKQLALFGRVLAE